MLCVNAYRYERNQPSLVKEAALIDDEISDAPCRRVDHNTIKSAELEPMAREYFKRIEQRSVESCRLEITKMLGRPVIIRH